MCLVIELVSLPRGGTRAICCRWGYLLQPMVTFFRAGPPLVIGAPSVRGGCYPSGLRLFSALPTLGISPTGASMWRGDLDWLGVTLLPVAQEGPQFPLRLWNPSPSCPSFTWTAQGGGAGRAVHSPHPQLGILGYDRGAHPVPVLTCRIRTSTTPAGQSAAPWAGSVPILDLPVPWPAVCIAIVSPWGAALGCSGG